MQNYRAVLRLAYQADGEVEAEIIAEDARASIEATILDITDGDTVEVRQVAPETSGITPEELINAMESTRNALILTKTKACWDVAKELDRLVLCLERQDYAFVSPYDHGHFWDIAEKILAEEAEDDTESVRDITG